MKFTSDGADLGSTIESYSRKGNYYKIKYLDNSESSYVSNNSDEVKRLQNIMLEQARERDAHEKISIIKLKRNILMVSSYLAALSTCMAYDKGNDLLTFISFILTGITDNIWRNKNEKIRELSKYKIFLDMVDDLKLFNESEILKCIEFENIYQRNFNINEIDKYSCGEIKRIRKQVDKLKKEKNGE